MRRDEDGAESIWAGLSVSYSLTVTGFVMAFQVSQSSTQAGCQRAELTANDRVASPLTT